MIFVNLPVRDLPKSMGFFTALGFSFNPQFSDETAACMVVSDTIFVMLLTHEKFASFSPKPITDTSRSLQVLITLARDSRAAVDAIVKAAVGAGGTASSAPTDDGFMYSHDFIDLDGHGWGVMWMDESAVQQ